MEVDGELCSDCLLDRAKEVGLQCSMWASAEAVWTECTVSRAEIILGKSVVAVEILSA